MIPIPIELPPTPAVSKSTMRTTNDPMSDPIPPEENMTVVTISTSVAEGMMTGMGLARIAPNAADVPEKTTIDRPGIPKTEEVATTVHGTRTIDDRVTTTRLEVAAQALYRVHIGKVLLHTFVENKAVLKSKVKQCEPTNLSRMLQAQKTV